MVAPLDAEVVSDPERLAELAPAWDALAVACGRPLCAPAWMLAWWRHLPAPGARLSVVAVHDGEELVAIAPFVAEPKGAWRIDLRMLGGAMPRTGPIALPGREWDAAQAVAGALARARPRGDVLALESGPVGSHWPRALAERWPGPLRPPLRRYYVQDSYVVSLAAGSFEEWMTEKGSHFRKRMRKVRRDVEALGGVARISTAETLSADVAAFMRLHASRWEGRGESAIVVRERQLTAVYEEVAAVHLADGRFRLYLLELDGEPVAAELLAAAGGEVASINGGWDEAHAKVGVSNACMLHAIEDAFARGDARLDWGPGDQLFKRRFADGNDPVCWTLLLVPRPRMPLTFARIAPTVARVEAREALKRALTPQRQEQLRTLRARVLGRG